MLHIIPRPITNTLQAHILRGVSTAQDRNSAMLLALTTGN
jgi:hypothetical protein